MEPRSEPRSARVLDLPSGVRGELGAWARRAWPREACGLLVGRTARARGGAALGRGPRDEPVGSGAPGRVVEVVRAVLCRNLRAERAADRYEVDPADHLRAELAARAEGLAVVGAWHSHPDGPAVPSETDRAEAGEPWSYLIVSVRGGEVAALRSWRLVGGAFVEERIAGVRG